MAQRGQWLAVAGILGLLGAVLVAGLAFNTDLRPVGQGSEAPRFEAMHLVSGDTLSLDDYRGDVLLLNVWATWCGPCEVEMPSIERLHQQLGPDGLRVVAVSVDASSAEDVLAWVRQRDLTFDVLQDRTGRTERLYQTTGLPESFVIDRHGTIVRKVIGATEWDHPRELALFRRLLRASAGDGSSDRPSDADRP